jgi:hypothetical protein
MHFGRKCPRIREFTWRAVFSLQMSKIHSVLQISRNRQQFSSVVGIIGQLIDSDSSLLPLSMSVIILGWVMRGSAAATKLVHPRAVRGAQPRGNKGARPITRIGRGVM